MGDLLAQRVTPAYVQERDQVRKLVQAVQAVAGASVEVAGVDQGSTGDAPAAAAGTRGVRLQAVELPAAKHSFVLLPRRGVAEHSFAWTAHCRRLARGDGCLPETVGALHFIAFACPCSSD